MAVNWTSTSNLHILSRPFSSRVTGHRQQPILVCKWGMDQWLLAVTSALAAKGLAKDLEVVGAGLIHCYSPPPPPLFPYHV